MNASCWKIDLMNHVFEKVSIGFTSQNGSEFNQIEGKIHEVEKNVTQDKSLDENPILLYMKEKSMNKKSNTTKFYPSSVDH